jgi:hypothetical protein
MFCSLKTLADARVVTSDGHEKRVVNFLFDDRSWSARFLVVDVGGWLTRRFVVVSTAAVEQPDWTRKSMVARLTREQLVNSPDADSQKPVARQQELALKEHFGWPDHAFHCSIPSALVPAQREFPIHTHDDPHLRGTLDLGGYAVWARDAYLGVLEDFILEQASWHVNYLVVKVGDWVYSHEQLISTAWVKTISWANHRVTLDRDAMACR